MDDAEKWVVVFESGTDYESEIVRDRLDDAGIPAVVDTKRDHAFFLNVGSLSNVFVRVPVAYEADARSILASPAISRSDLEAAALAATTDVQIDPDGVDDEDEKPSPDSGGE